MEIDFVLSALFKLFTNTDFWIIISQIGVAIGTLILAKITYESIKNSKKQLEYLRKQTQILKNDKFPLLKVVQCKIKSNLFKIKLKNVGKKEAFKIGLEAKFRLAHPNLSEDKKFIDFSYDPQELIDEKNKSIIRSNGYISYNKEMQITQVFPGEEDELLFEPKFGLWYLEDNQIRFGSTVGRIIELNELIDILNKNEKRFIEIEINLVYQDYSGNQKERTRLFSYVFDIKTDKNFEDYSKFKRRGNLTSIGHGEEEIRTEGAFSHIYDSVTDPRKQQI